MFEKNQFKFSVFILIFLCISFDPYLQLIQSSTASNNPFLTSFVPDHCEIGLGNNYEQQPLVVNENQNIINITYYFKSLKIEYDNEYIKLSIDDLCSYGDPGSPILPFKTTKILLPPEVMIDDIEVVPMERTPVFGRFIIEPGIEPIPVIQNKNIKLTQNNTIYSSSSIIPEKQFDLVSVQTLFGYKILILNLYPIQYIPSEGAISYYKSMNVVIKTSPLSTSKVIGKQLPENTSLYRGLPQDREKIRKIVDNPEMTGAYTSTINKLSNSFEYVVITNDTFLSAFQPLVSWKNERGITSTIVTVQQILNNYTGYDTQEKIRNFIKYAYSNWGTQYVLLGGDVEIIPVRGLSAYDDNDIASDLYYAALDGNWDNNGNHIYGESGEYDLYAEVYVGRAPVSTTAEASVFVNKTITYERDKPTDYLNKVLMLAAKLDTQTDGGIVKDFISNMFSPYYEVTKLYERDFTASIESTTNQLNLGQHIVNNIGHANNHVIGLACSGYSQYYSESDVDALTNGPRYFLFYSIGCYANAFDDRDPYGNYIGDAISEHFLNNPNGGAFAFIGNSRYGWYYPGYPGEGPSDLYDKEFFDVILNEDVYNIGRALQNSKEDLAGFANDEIMRWVYYELNLLGDPETPITLTTPEHEVSVQSFEAPDWLLPGGSTVVNATVGNYGTNDETSVAVRFIVDNETVDAATIPFLANGTSAVVSFDWTAPSAEKAYNLTVYAEPVAGEEATQDNTRTKTVQVKEIEGYVKAVVLDSYGTDYPDYCIWSELSEAWYRYGHYVITIDYTSLNKEDITYEDIKSTNADVLIISCAYNRYSGWEFSDSEIAAITKYVYEGHGLIATAGTFYNQVPNNIQLAPLFGMEETLGDLYGTSGLFALYYPDCPVFANMSNPYQTAYGISFYPWAVTTGTVLGETDDGYAAIITNDINGSTGHVALYFTHFPEEAYSGVAANENDKKLFYNSIIWAGQSYQVAGHELCIMSFEAPGWLLPGESTVVNATVGNYGTNDETDVAVRFIVDNETVDTATIPFLANGTSAVVSFDWTAPSAEKACNLTVYAEPVAGEEATQDNTRTKTVQVTAEAVALFQDYLPRGFTADQDLLELHSIVYDVYSSSDMGSINLSRYAKIIIASDQDQTFYDRLAFYAEWFEQYVRNGGILEIHACDHGWNGGQWSVMPGGFTHVFSPSDEVDIAYENHPILLTPNLITDEELDGWGWATHGYFESIPDGSNVILTQHSSGYSVFVESIYGDGCIVASMQPLEWGYSQGYSRFLENVILYFPQRLQHDIAITSFYVPEFIEPNSTVLVNATVTNRGLSDESNVKLLFLINNAFVYNATIPKLLNGTSCTINYLWSPVEGTYNVTAYVLPVPGEDYTLNNQASRHVIVSRNPVHFGDLIIKGDEVFVIENVTFTQIGNIYVRDNALLIIRNAELRLNQTSWFQYGIYVSGSAALQTKNASITSQYGFEASIRDSALVNINSSIFGYAESQVTGYIFTYDNSIVTINNSTVSLIYAYEYSDVSIYNSVFNYVYGSDNSVVSIQNSNTNSLGVDGSSLISFYHSTTSYLGLNFWDSQKATLYNLHTGPVEYWNLYVNESANGINWNLTVVDSSITQGWGVSCYDDSVVSVCNSTLAYLDCYENSNAFIVNSNVARGLNCYSDSVVSVSDSTLDYIDCYENSDVFIINCNVAWSYVSPWGSSNVYIEGSTLRYLDIGFAGSSSSSTKLLVEDADELIKEMGIFGETTFEKSWPELDIMVQEYLDRNVEQTDLKEPYRTKRLLMEQILQDLHGSEGSRVDKFSTATASLNDLTPGFNGFWNLYVNGTVSGVNWNLTLVDSSITQGWELYCYGDSIVSVYDSTLAYLHCYEDSDVSIFDSDVTWGLSMWSFTGTIGFDNATLGYYWQNYYSQYYMYGNVSFGEYANFNLWFWSSVVTRNYLIHVYPPVANVTLMLYNEDGALIWRGITDNEGFANFNETFSDGNYTSIYELHAEGFPHVKEVKLLSETPIILSAFFIDAKTNKEYYSSNEQIIITANVTKIGTPAIGVNITAFIINPEDVPLGTLTLYDDGTHGDIVPDDGVYSNTFSGIHVGNQTGTYKVTIYATIPDDGVEEGETKFIFIGDSNLLVKVINTLNEPAPYVSLNVLDQSSGSIIRFWYGTDENGFYYTTLPEGSYTVMAWSNWNYWYETGRTDSFFLLNENLEINNSVTAALLNATAGIPILLQTNNINEEPEGDFYIDLYPAAGGFGLDVTYTNSTGEAIIYVTPNIYNVGARKYATPSYFLYELNIDCTSPRTISFQPTLANTSNLTLSFHKIAENQDGYACIHPSSLPTPFGFGSSGEFIVTPDMWEVWEGYSYINLQNGYWVYRLECNPTPIYNLSIPCTSATFNLGGKLDLTLSTDEHFNPGDIVPIYWNLTDSFGNIVGYIYEGTWHISKNTLVIKTDIQKSLILNATGNPQPTAYEEHLPYLTIRDPEDFPLVDTEVYWWEKPKQYQLQTNAASGVYKAEMSVNTGPWQNIIAISDTFAVGEIPPQNHPPTIGGFQSPSIVYANKYFFLNATITDPDGVTDLVNATIEISNGIILKWVNGPDAFSKQQDTYGYCTLDATDSFKTLINSTTYRLSFKIKLGWSFPEGSVDILSFNTKCFDSYGKSGSSSHEALFTFEDDLIVYSASVDDSRINPSQPITFSGTLYYQGTTTPPEDASGITVKVELGKTYKGSTTTINSDGTFTISGVAGEATVNSYLYNIYSVTDQNSVLNQTIPVVVDRLSVELLASQMRPLKGTAVTISWTITRQYDSSKVASFTFALSRNGTIWMSELTNGSVTDASDAEVEYTYDTNSVVDNTYGLNTFISTNITVHWIPTINLYLTDCTVVKGITIINFSIGSVERISMAQYKVNDGAINNMIPLDGIYDETTEEFHLEINSSTLSDGFYNLYLRGSNEYDTSEWVQVKLFVKSLSKKYNIIALIVQPYTTLHASDIVKALGNKVTAIWKWDNTEQKYQPYIPGFSSSAEDFELRVGDGYFIYLNQEATLVQVGEP